MNLTSWNRLRFMLGGDDPFPDTLAKKHKFLTWIPAISNRVELYMDRYVELKSHTEYRDSELSRSEYWMKGIPISTITTVKSDSTGEYDGSEFSESDMIIGQNNESIVMESPVTPALKGLQFIYTGGLANHGTQSVYVLSGEGSAPFTVGKFAEGQTSEALGIVTAKTGANITIEVLFGVFQALEVIKGKLLWSDTTFVSNMEATIASVTSRCLAESYPDIVTATELEIRYMDAHRRDYENSSSAKDGTTRKDTKTDYSLVPEVRALLEFYVNEGI